jgi:hypothetical protein
LLAGFSEPISSTLKMEAIRSSETSVETQRTTRRHISKDDNTLQGSDNLNTLHINPFVGNAGTVVGIL